MKFLLENSDRWRSYLGNKPFSDSFLFFFTVWVPHSTSCTSISLVRISCCAIFLSLLPFKCIFDIAKNNFSQNQFLDRSKTRCWRQNLYVGDIFWVLVSPTSYGCHIYFVSNIRHQHRCNRPWHTGKTVKVTPGRCSQTERVFQNCTNVHFENLQMQANPFVISNFNWFETFNTFTDNWFLWFFRNHEINWNGLFWQWILNKIWNSGVI